MANPEHLEILQQGIEAWNAWRDQNGDIRPDLSIASLFRINLAPTDIISQADLFPADPIQTLGSRRFRIRPAIIGANLANTHFDKAYLAEATLTHADFTRATLVKASLTGADLSEAHLYETVFSFTNLTETWS